MAARTAATAAISLAAVLHSGVEAKRQQVLDEEALSQRALQAQLATKEQKAKKVKSKQGEDAVVIAEPCGPGIKKTFMSPTEKDGILALLEEKSIWTGMTSYINDMKTQKMSAELVADSHQQQIDAEPAVVKPADYTEDALKTALESSCEIVFSAGNLETVKHKSMVPRLEAAAGNETTKIKRCAVFALGGRIGKNDAVPAMIAEVKSKMGISGTAGYFSEDLVNKCQEFLKCEQVNVGEYYMKNMPCANYAQLPEDICTSLAEQANAAYEKIVADHNSRIADMERQLALARGNAMRYSIKKESCEEMQSEMQQRKADIQHYDKVIGDYKSKKTAVAKTLNKAKRTLRKREKDRKAQQADLDKKSAAFEASLKQYNDENEVVRVEKLKILSGVGFSMHKLFEELTNTRENIEKVGKQYTIVDTAQEKALTLKQLMHSTIGAMKGLAEDALVSPINVIEEKLSLDVFKDANNPLIRKAMDESSTAVVNICKEKAGKLSKVTYDAEAGTIKLAGESSKMGLDYSGSSNSLKDEAALYAKATHGTASGLADICADEVANKDAAKKVVDTIVQKINDMQNNPRGAKKVVGVVLQRLSEARFSVLGEWAAAPLPAGEAVKTFEDRLQASTLYSEFKRLNFVEGKVEKAAAGLKAAMSRLTSMRTDLEATEARLDVAYEEAKAAFEAAQKAYDTWSEELAKFKKDTVDVDELIMSDAKELLAKTKDVIAKLEADIAETKAQLKKVDANLKGTEELLEEEHAKNVEQMKSGAIEQAPKSEPAKMAANVEEPPAELAQLPKEYEIQYTNLHRRYPTATNDEILDGLKKHSGHGGLVAQELGHAGHVDIDCPSCPI